MLFVKGHHIGRPQSEANAHLWKIIQPYLLQHLEEGRTVVQVLDHVLTHEDCTCVFLFWPRHTQRSILHALLNKWASQGTLRTLARPGRRRGQLTRHYALQTGLSFSPAPG
jgi:hypothetical protein